MEAGSFWANPWAISIGGGLLVGLILLGADRLTQRKAHPSGDDKTRKKARVDDPSLWIMGAVAAPVVGALIGVILVLGNPFNEEEDKEPNQRVTVGQTVTDGSFDWVVLSFECGLAKINGEPDLKPQGEFCMALIRAVNRGQVSGSPDDQPTLHVGDERYPAEFEVPFGFFDDIFPNHSAEVRFLFDIPAGSRPTALELHSEFGSPGVLVVLS